MNLSQFSRGSTDYGLGRFGPRISDSAVKNLVSSLDRADFYDEEVGTAIDGLASAMEPIIMVILAVVVGGIVIALYMPMFQSVTMVGG